MRRRLRFSREYLGKTFLLGESRRFTAFRHVILDPGPADTGRPPAVLVVRFKFARGSRRANRIASLFPVPLIVGFPGFREKVWLIDERAGDWQGAYEWESGSRAWEYAQSFVLGMMIRRAVKDSVSFAVMPKTSLSHYLGTRLLE
jgi:hypothetical protein